MANTHTNMACYGLGVATQVIAQPPLPLQRHPPPPPSLLSLSRMRPLMREFCRAPSRPLPFSLSLRFTVNWDNTKHLQHCSTPTCQHPSPHSLMCTSHRFVFLLFSLTLTLSPSFVSSFSVICFFGFSELPLLHLSPLASRLLPHCPIFSFFKVACGLFHTACISSYGSAFSWGRNLEVRPFSLLSLLLRPSLTHSLSLYSTPKKNNRCNWGLASGTKI